MAVMKKKGNKGLPPISTASLPDVIFMILFFFMVSTTMRDQELLVRYKLPEATEVQKLEKKSLVSFIHIGPPSMTMQAKFGTAPRIQLNDSYKSTREDGYRDRREAGASPGQRPENILCGLQVAGILIRGIHLKKSRLRACSFRFRRGIPAGRSRG